MSVSFSLGGVTKTVSNPDLEDKLDLDSHQVVQPKASGGFYRFALADVTDTQRELKWSNLRLSELQDLTNFFNFQAQGALNEFTFTDERGAQWTAYFLNATLDSVTVSDEQYGPAGSFVSGGNTIPTTLRSGGFYELSVKLHLTPGASTTEGDTSDPATSAPTTQAPLLTPEPTYPPTTGPTAPHTAPHTPAPTAAPTTAPPPSGLGLFGFYG